MPTIYSVSQIHVLKQAPSTPMDIACKPLVIFWTRLSASAQATTCKSGDMLDYLIPSGKVSLEKLVVPQLVTKFPAFYGTRMFITVQEPKLVPILSQMNPVRGQYPFTLKSVLIFFYLLLGLPCGIFLQFSPTKNLSRYVTSLV